MGIELTPPSPLEKTHILKEFDCGYPQLNLWLQRYAWQNQKAGAARTFVVCTGKRVVGFHSLAVGAVEHVDAPGRIKKGLARHPIPVMVLARLAVDRSCQGLKIGKGLLKDAILRTVTASQFAGIRGILVHAKDKKAREFYGQFGFEPSPVDELKLMLLLKDARKIFEEL